MNITNIDKAIAIMGRAISLNMNDWQTCAVKREKPESTIAGLHACGNSACFAGYIAISPEFKADGGSSMNHGGPIYKPTGKEGSAAIARWLGVTWSVSNLFVFGRVLGHVHPKHHSLFYRTNWEDVKPKDVIERLEELKRIGPDEFLKLYEKV